MKTVAQKRSAIEGEAADWVARRDAGLTAAEESELGNWLASDPRHDRAFARHDRAWAILDRPIAGGRAPAMVVELRQRARARRRRRAAAAAAIAVGLFALLALRPIRAPVEKPESNRVSTTAVIIQPEKRVLPDGSIVELKGGAEIEVEFGGPLRRVYLRKGEAHFDVARNTERPFVVSAGNITVRALGTAFSVQLSPAQIEVLVTEGRVGVEHAGDVTSRSSAASPAVLPLASQPVTMAAGTRMAFGLKPQSADVASVPVPVEADEIAQRLAWRATRLEFTATPLGEAVSLMSRHNRLHFVIADPTLAKLEVSGIFRADNTEAFLLLLDGSLGVKAQRSGDTITLGKIR